MVPGTIRQVTVVLLLLLLLFGNMCIIIYICIKDFPHHWPWIYMKSPGDFLPSGCDVERFANGQSLKKSCCEFFQIINTIPVLNLDVAVNMFQIASGYLT